MQNENNLQNELFMVASEELVQGEFVAIDESNDAAASCSGSCQAGSCIVVF